MYLRSMRREVYIIAREHNLPLLIVHVAVSLEVAQLRNSARPRPISSASIEKIYAAFQPPNKEFIFDRNFITLFNDSETM